MLPSTDSGTTVSRREIFSGSIGPASVLGSKSARFTSRIPDTSESAWSMPASDTDPASSRMVSSAAEPSCSRRSASSTTFAGSRPREIRC
ncbi:MAG: hypothetical protein H6Q89_2501 [Myxococcaceae bacterium]|nr:hypothetical protein [Myxococcaceae bacterium]